jgi:DNA polymerase-1
MGILLLDTYSLFFRSFYGLPPMTTRAGKPTGALYGFSTLLLKLLRERTPEGVALALDRPTATFRDELFPAYKAGRPPLPSPLREQLAELPSLLAALGFPCFSSEGFEADDVLATLTRELNAAGHEVLVVSGDRDLLQLVDERARVLFVGQRGKAPILYDHAAVVARFGFAPDRLPLYSALVGERADNLPKVAGIGEATATRLVQRFEDAEALIRDLADVPDPRVRAIVAEHTAQIRTSERLARLRCDVPLAPGPRFARLEAEAILHTRKRFEELEFVSLLKRLPSVE